MKKILIFLGALQLSSPANAEWSYQASNPWGYDYFLDFDTLRKEDEFRYIWSLSNYNKLDKYGDQSVTKLYEFDCNRSAQRELAVYFYDQPKGEGNITKAFRNLKEDFAYSPHGSVVDTLLKNTCSR